MVLQVPSSEKRVNRNILVVADFGMRAVHIVDILTVLKKMKNGANVNKQAVASEFFAEYEISK